VSQGIVAFAGILATPVVPPFLTAQSIANTPQQEDPRFALLTRFFKQRNCPAAEHVDDFLIAADTNALDWRLLPSISFIESGGGKASRNNNILGWGSAEKKFPSIKAGIHAVANRLAQSKLYKNKDILGILKTYNTNAEYPARVLSVMRAIGPLDAGESLLKVTYSRNLTP
jgi:hypothetical protein